MVPSVSLPSSAGFPFGPPALTDPAAAHIANKTALFKLFHSIQLMQNAAHLTAFGGALIVIGALGIYLTQPTVVTEPEVPQKNRTRIFSYGALVTGVALVAFATYRLQSNVNLLMRNFEVVSC